MSECNDLPPSVLARYPRRGRTAREVAERTGTSISTAQRWTSEPREVYLARAQKRHEKIWALRAQGLTMREIAKRTGVSVGTVHYALNK